MRTAYISALNFPNPQAVFGADPMGASLGQNYAVRFHGKLSIVAAGNYQFQLNAHSGGVLRIDGVSIDAGAAVPLTAGDHEIEAIYYQSGDASPAAQLLWTPPGGAEGVVPPSALTTGAAIAAGGEGRFQFQVPAALSGIRCRVGERSGLGSARPIECLRGDEMMTRSYLILAFAALPAILQAQFNSGSTGTDGALNLTTRAPLRWIRPRCPISAPTTFAISPRSPLAPIQPLC